MAIGDALAPTGSFLGDGIGNLLQYSWVLLVFVAIGFIGGGAYIWNTVRKKKSQWTHTLYIRRVMDNNRLSKPVTIKMRRFPLIKKAEVFELETPLLGGYLFPELDEYSGENEFSIVLDKNNRIYTNKGEFWEKDKRDVNVSAKHSEIDLARANLKAKYQDIHKINKRIEWATIAKYAFLFIAIIAGSIVAITGLQKWAETQDARAEAELAQAQAFASLAEVMQTVEATVNTQKLEIIPAMERIYGTQNLQPIINQPVVIPPTNGTG